jgi:hypothetical protein
MKKQIVKLTESDLNKIVGKAVKKVIKEGLNDDPNLIIDKIGEEVLPLYQQLARLQYVYSHYEKSENSWLRNMILDLNEATARLEHLIYIVNH